MPGGRHHLVLDPAHRLDPPRPAWRGSRAARRPRCRARSGRRGRTPGGAASRTAPRADPRPPRSPCSRPLAAVIARSARSRSRSCSASMSLLTPSRLTSQGRVRPCTTRVASTTAKAMKRSSARAGNGVPVVRGERDGERQRDRRHPAHPRPPHDDGLPPGHRDVLVHVPQPVQLLGDPRGGQQVQQPYADHDRDHQPACRSIGPQSPGADAEDVVQLQADQPERDPGDEGVDDLPEGVARQPGRHVVGLEGVLGQEQRRGEHREDAGAVELLGERVGGEGHQQRQADLQGRVADHAHQPVRAPAEHQADHDRDHRGQHQFEHACGSEKSPDTAAATATW